MTDEKLLDDFSDLIEELDNLREKHLKPIIAELWSVYDWVRRKLERR